MNARAGILLAAAAVLLAGCGEDPGAEDPRTVTVFAAASLRTTFDEIAAVYEDLHEDVDVRLSFAGSADLATQIQEGAPADVFAAADTATMDRLSADDLLESNPANFASNTLRIAVPPGNPAGVASLEDLTASDVALVVCAPEVPCGHAALRVAKVAGVTLTPVSEEQSVTDVLNKVVTGEADAGLVYVTDVLSAGDTVEGIDFPESRKVVNTYPIATLAGAAEPALAAEFMELVLSDRGRSILQEAGFVGP